MLISFIIPFLMAFLHVKFKKAHYIFDFIAIILFVFLGNLVGLSIYNSIEDHAVFTTAIHGLLIDPNFLVCSGYIFIYTTYKLMLNLK